MSQIIKKTILIGVREPQQIEIVIDAVKREFKEHTIIRGSLFGLNERKNCLVTAQPEIGGEVKSIVLQPYRLGIKISIECNDMKSLYEELVGLLKHIDIPFTLEIL